MKVLAMTCCCVDVFPEQNKVCAGGNALNLAVNCAKADLAQVYLMGNIGNDRYAEEVKKVVDRFHVDRSRLYEVEGETANHIVHISADGDRYFTENSWTDGVYGDYRISKEDESYMQSMDAVAVTCYDPNFKKIIETRRHTDFLLAVDFHDEKINPEWQSLFDAVDLFFISGTNETLPQLKSWSEKYSTVFIATMGAAGSVAYQGGKEYVCPAEKVETVVDTTGCGDSYQGTFIVYYLKSKDILTSMKEGSKAAAITLSFVGAC